MSSDDGPPLGPPNNFGPNFTLAHTLLPMEDGSAPPPDTSHGG